MQFQPIDDAQQERDERDASPFAMHGHGPVYERRHVQVCTARDARAGLGSRRLRSAEDGRGPGRPLVQVESKSEQVGVGSDIVLVRGGCFVSSRVAARLDAGALQIVKGSAKRQV